MNRILYVPCILIIIIIIIPFFIYKKNKTNSLNKFFIKNISSNIRRREDLGILFEEERFESAIEIGVQNGFFCNSLMSSWKSCRTYVMVDPWLKQKYYDDAANVENFHQNNVFQNAMEVVKKYTDIIDFIIFKTTSENAINYLKNKQYDFIYLDARHDYISVKEDIKWYYPLVKPGGILAGHDYQDENGKEWKMDKNGNVITKKKAVKSAVDEFANNNNLKVVTTNEGSYETWMIRKPKFI